MFDSETLWQAFTITMILFVSILMGVTLGFVLHNNPMLILFVGIFLVVWAVIYWGIK